MYCDSDKCPRPKEILPENYEHAFAGYGYYVKFHPECCPLQMDGSDCDYEHPNPDVLEKLR